jgi:hypothetical protein
VQGPQHFGRCNNRTDRFAQGVFAEMNTNDAFTGDGARLAFARLREHVADA